MGKKYGYFAKEDTYADGKWAREVLDVTALGEMPLKTIWDTTTHLWERLQWTTGVTPKAGEDAEKQVTHTAHGNVTGAASPENSLVVS